MKRSRRRLILFWLIVGHLACNPRWWEWLPIDADTNEGMALLFGFGFAQATLLGSGIALVQKCWSIKLGVLLLYVSVSVAPPWPSDPFGWDYQAFLCLIVLIACCSWLITRIVYGRFRLVNERFAMPQPSMQFSVCGLLFLTAAISIVFGAARLLEVTMKYEYVTVVFVAFICGLLAPPLLLWASLSRRNPAAPIAAAIIAAVGGGLLLGIKHDWDEMSIWPIILCTQVAVCCATLLVVRACGYRLVRRPPAVTT